MWLLDMFLDLSNHGMNLDRLEIWGNCDVEGTCPGPFQVAFFPFGVVGQTWKLSLNPATYSTKAIGDQPA